MSINDHRLMMTTTALIFTWVIFIGFVVFTHFKSDEIKRYSVTYDCEIAEQLDSTPIEVKAKCKALHRTLK
jgi:hypothetical protein